ncbi:MAG: hypothetical protein GY841_20725 [FCB group bacterium]|nr:hypothetical protein [FCB group bacterium]
MSKKLIILAAIFITALFIGLGCSDDDDDCPACPDQIVYMGWADGVIYLDPETYMSEMQIHRFAGVMPNIDSVMVGDSMVEPDDIDYDYYYDYGDNYWYIYFDEDGDASTYMYESGDIATFTVWGDGMTATCNLKLLDYDDDEIDSILPNYAADTLGVGDSVTCRWTSSENADYYNVQVEVIDYVDGSNTWYYHYYNTTDTFFTVTPEMLTDSVSHIWVTAIPVTGPDPVTGASNWSGNYITGRLYSYAGYDYTRIIGWNSPTPSLKAPVGADNEERPRKTPNEILSSLNQVFK